jgi:hypothetical protein
MQQRKTIFFDRNDYELLAIANEVLDQSSHLRSLRSLLVEHMHPEGIKEMAAPRGLRIAYAIAALLGSLEHGRADDRLKALRSLRDEVFSSASGFFQKNTARVLIQIMKELLRSRHDGMRQLKLAHDFRMASTGNPRIVRKQLQKYHLLEMPEQWNQLAFDDHVHDANTKGRKSPTHLIMDAWIKGIRFLTVIHYNYVTHDAIEELLEAGAILQVKVQVGIEYSSPFRDKFIRFSWEPQGFSSDQAFLDFLRDKAVAEFMAEGKMVSEYQQEFVKGVLDVFNSRHRQALNQEFQVDLAPLQLEGFLHFVGTGQPSVLHLARFIHNHLVGQNRALVSALQNQAEQAGEPAAEAREQLAKLRTLTIDYLIDNYLTPANNPELPNPFLPSDGTHVPPLLQENPKRLMRRLLSLHSSSSFILKLSNLSLQDTLELLYRCEGMISHIEVFNLQDSAHGIVAGISPPGRHAQQGNTVQLRSPQYHYQLIHDLQYALNNDNVIALKRVIRAIIWECGEDLLRLQTQLETFHKHDREKQAMEQELQALNTRKAELLDILFNLEKFHNYYKKKTLGSRVGSGSTGLAEHRHGMGLVVMDTLPRQARKTVHADLSHNQRMLIPITATLIRHQHIRRKPSSLWAYAQSFRLLRKLDAKGDQWQDWTVDNLTVHPTYSGNIATLGGMKGNGDNEGLVPLEKTTETLGNPYTYLNTHLKNSLKVLCGFIPAFLTFFLTKDWWVLAYFGAFIWFGITGCRNIIQSVLGGGGLQRSPLLPWNSLVSWSRIADSLFYTGFSVPLLDYLVKTLLLDRHLGITTGSNPILLYAVMGLANGVYISSHNLFRGLPKSAAFGNFFRSILAIPLAVLFNWGIGSMLAATGMPDVSGMLQKWAAVISKFASDCVAALIEGLADRQVNIKLRVKAYHTKIASLFNVYSRLDLLFPEEDVLDILQSPKMMMATLDYEAKEQEKIIIVNALDLMYFWMYQPRARKALKFLLQKMSKEEVLIFYRSQLILKRYREISQIFVDGLVGRDFSKALAFYLDRHQSYLNDIAQMIDTHQVGRQPDSA